MLLSSLQPNTQELVDGTNKAKKKKYCHTCGVKIPPESDKLLCHRCIKKIINEETKPLAKDFLDLKKEMTSTLKSLRTAIDEMKGEERPSTLSQNPKTRQKEKLKKPPSHS